MLKFLLVSFIACCLCSSVIAQAKFPPVDKSPMDMCYYPVNYPVLKIQDKMTEPLVARIIYSRPQKNGRQIFGELVAYGEVWRLGANEATEIEFFAPVRIGGTKIKKGRYTLYCIPTQDKWTLILNTETDTWGSFKYDENKDIARIDAPVQKQTENLEFFAMTFEKSSSGANLIIGWDDVVASFPIYF
jgi:hypothetical protein